MGRRKRRKEKKKKMEGEIKKKTSEIKQNEEIIEKLKIARGKDNKIYNVEKINMDQKFEELKLENAQRNETKDKEKMFQNGFNERGEVIVEELHNEKEDIEDGEVVDEEDDDENKEVCKNCKKETAKMIECDGCGNWMCGSC